MANFSPLITVLMPVYNAERYLHEAISSILEQTFTDFELMIINDGSTDSTMDIINTFSDSRISVVQNNGNQGIVYTLNRGIALANGTYIARMDSDDVALPQRLEKQFVFMEKYPNIGLLGTNTLSINEEGKIMNEGKALYSLDDRYRSPYIMRWNLLWGAGISHPTAFIRKEILSNYDLYYDATYEYGEDFELWTRIVPHVEITYLPEVLLYYRINPNGISCSKSEKQDFLVFQITKREISILDMTLADHDQLYALHRLKFRGEVIPDINFVKSAYLLVKIYRAFTKRYQPIRSKKSLYKGFILFPILQLAGFARKDNVLISFYLISYYFALQPLYLLIRMVNKVKKILF